MTFILGPTALIVQGKHPRLPHARSIKAHPGGLGTSPFENFGALAQFAEDEFDRRKQIVGWPLGKPPAVGHIFDECVDLVELKSS